MGVSATLSGRYRVIFSSICKDHRSRRRGEWGMAGKTWFLSSRSEKKCLQSWEGDGWGGQGIRLCCAISLFFFGARVAYWKDRESCILIVSWYIFLIFLGMGAGYNPWTCFNYCRLWDSIWSIIQRLSLYWHCYDNRKLSGAVYKNPPLPPAASQ